MAVATGDLAAVAAECLCGWRGRAGEGVLKQGCDVALPQEMIDRTTEAFRTLAELARKNSEGYRRWFHGEGRRFLEAYLRRADEAKEKTFVWCPCCDHTATFAGSKFEPIEVG